MTRTMKAVAVLYALIILGALSGRAVHSVSSIRALGLFQVVMACISTYLTAQSAKTKDRQLTWALMTGAYLQALTAVFLFRV